jgi:hypothetical protein
MADGLAMLHSTMVFGVIALATIGVGALPGAALRLRTCNLIGRLVWESSLGLLAFTTLLGWLGQFVGIERRAIVIATSLAAVGGLARIIHLLRSTSDDTVAEDSVSNAPPAWAACCLTVCAALAIGAAFISALAPPTAGDALVYHLEIPKRFLDAGALTFNPDDDNIVYPLLAEMGFLWALAFNDAAATSLVHWGCGLLLVGATFVLAQPQLGTAWARAAACVTALTPGVNNQMTAPLNDVALALFAVLAIAGWARASSTGSARDFVLVGLMLGGAVGVKYTGLLFMAALGASWLAAAIGDVGRRRQLLIGACTAVVATAVTAGLWYGRAAWYRGDPVYPFLTRQIESAELHTFPEQKAPLGRGPTVLITAPWSMTMEPARFGGRAHQLGPLFLMFVPIAIACGCTTKIATPLWIAALYGGGCLLLRQNVRFLLPIVPVFAVAVAAAWREMRNCPQAPRWIAATATASIVLFLTAIPIGRLRHTATATFGAESFAAFLQRNEPSYVVARWINENLPPDSRILSQEQRAFYFEPTVTRESLYRRRTQYAKVGGTPDAVWSKLRDDGFSHLLTADVAGSPTVGYDATLSHLVEAAAISDSPSAPAVVRQWLHNDGDGTARRYRLWELR